MGSALDQKYLSECRVALPDKPRLNSSMPFNLENIIPWGRSLDEYNRMFRLTPEDRKRTILGCADGPASFNAEMTFLGGNVVSIDPIYTYSVKQISSRIDEAAPEVYSKVSANQQDFVWSYFSTPEELLEKRLKTMTEFISDFEKGLEEGRYIPGELPGLPFKNQQFDLALCSHFLFLYSEHLSFEFHLASILECLRVAQEVRIFPLVELGNAPSRHLPAVIERLNNHEYECQILTVDYVFQSAGNKMLKVFRQLS